ncbi:hypothetical protein PLICRDRAFT_179795 [Plicaturopsis crispa FD-325 SS-3]|uniref:Carboxymuconolactone decarboxylase-like domain-containing protein n=1 Tax=Plicaturopsis crispa FD-325 SS-3 TaxID=944288 RepID=A0A0C9SKP9_PLICR|nr:hypothetical protein PLICRDRAFT_179795 [Plicaturopsis crispa FD-325 SS-3]
MTADDPLTHITPAYLDALKNSFPGTPNPWYLVAAVTFAASNLADAVPLVFKHAFEDVKNQPHDAQLHFVREFRDAIFKSSMICGLPKCIQGLTALGTATPDNLKDTDYLRDPHKTTDALTANGQAAFNKTYGSTADSTQKLFKQIFPDFESASITFVYGSIYGYYDYVTPVHTSYSVVAALIACDTPKQTAWHLQSAINNGATLPQVRAVRSMAITAATTAGIVGIYGQSTYYSCSSLSYFLIWT